MSDPSKKLSYSVRFTRKFTGVEHATVRVDAEDVMEAINVAIVRASALDGTAEYLGWHEDIDEFRVLSCEVSATEPDGTRSMKPIV